MPMGTFMRKYTCSGIAAVALLAGVATAGGNVAVVSADTTSGDSGSCPRVWV